MNKTPKFHYEITFPDFDSSETIRAYVKKYLAKLERTFARIISCHVAIRAPHMHRRRHIYHINIHLEIPGEDIVINNQPGKNMAHSDVRIAIRDAFRAAHRQLRKRVKTMRKKTKPKDNYEKAFIKSFDPNQEYGFLRVPGGREVYFHQNSLVNGSPSELKPGSRVNFIEELGEKGNHVTSMSIAS